jgi:predicted  nucleic acid-binding Zn-ribbon protein
MSLELTSEVRTQIDQRKAMIARARHIIDAASAALVAEKDKSVIAAHQGVIATRTARIADLEAQISQLTTTPTPTPKTT